MKKSDIGNIMAVSGATIMGASAFTALISGAVLSDGFPYTSQLHADKAEKIANAVATKLGYETQLVSDSGLMHKNTKYLLTPYDSLYHDCTGQLPTNNSFKWKLDSSGQYYARVPKDSYSASNYTISNNQVDPSKKDIIQEFNTQYKSAVHSATYDPGNPHTIDTCTKILIVVGIVFSSALVITIVGCCLGGCNSDESKKNNNALQKKQENYASEGQPSIAPVPYSQQQ